MRRKALIACLILISCLLFAGCSAERDKSKNYVSPYDKEFDPENVDEAEADLSEEEYLERAKAAYDRGLYSVARDNWNKLREQYPSSYYATLGELKIADTYFYAGDYPTAVTSYDEFLKLHPAHEAIPYVRFQLGNAHREQYMGVAHDQGPLQSAIKNYRRLIEDYPGNELVLPARRSISTCRELLAEHEHFIARFYARQGYDKAEQKRLEDLVRAYPETRAAEKARDDLYARAPSAPVLLAESGVERGERKRREEEAKGGPKGSKPQVPELILADNDQRESPVEARFRLLQPPRVVEADIIGEPRKAEPIPTAETEPRFVSCNEENGLLVFSAQFSAPIEIAGNAAGDSHRWVLREIGTPMPAGILEPDHTRTLKECDANGVRFRFRAVKQSEKYFVAELEQAPASAKLDVFTLDRPSRLVVIVEP